MPRLLRPHLVPKSVVLSLPHLHSNFFASGAINLENHWNDYENYEGTANLSSEGKCPVIVDLLRSIRVFVVVEHSTGHAGVHGLRPIERRIIKLFLSVCLKFIKYILSL